MEADGFWQLPLFPRCLLIHLPTSYCACATFCLSLVEITNLLKALVDFQRCGKILKRPHFAILEARKININNRLSLKLTQCYYKYNTSVNCK